MSTASRVLSPGGGPSSKLDERERRLPAPARRILDYLNEVSLADWITLGLLGVMLVSVGWSVQLADWGDLPSLLPTLLLGWAAAFIAHRSPVPVYVKIAVAIILGFAVIMWQGSILADGANVADRARDAWDRFWAWIAVAREGGVSADTVPFALMFMFASWVTAYTVTALTFRLRNPWAPVVLLTVGLLNNLSFRPGQYEHTFFIFILAAVALFAHLTTVRRTDRWDAEGVSYPNSLRWTSMRDGLLFGGIVVAITVLLPLVEVRSDRLNSAWDVVKSPITALEDPANRLLSGVDGPGDEGALDVRDSVLSFGGSITLTPEPLMWVTSRYSRMLPARVYDEYTSAGWLANSNVSQSVTARTELTQAPDDVGRQRVDMLVQPLLDTNMALPVGGAYAMDRDVEVEYLVPASYGAPLTGGSGSLATLPVDVRDFVFELRFALRDAAPRERGESVPTLSSQPLIDAEVVSELVEQLLPEDLGAEIIVNKDGLAQSLVINRVGPIEQVGLALSETLDADRLYTVTSYVSVADDAELAASLDDYPGWVRDRYLQLPSTLPREIRELSSQIIRDAGAKTPHEKVQAIKEFLQSQEYSLEIEGPSPTVDGVYYFLFQTQNEPCPSDKPDCDVDKIKGYSQYFGSAGTVLLRAAGVPARMISGWASGDYVESVGKFLIRDKHRHGWTQVYYADYGWIDVEVTPAQEDLDRTQVFSVEPSGAAIPAIGAGSDEDDPLFLQDIADLERIASEARERQAQDQLNAQSPDSGASYSGWLIAIPVVIAVALVALMAAWFISLRGMSKAERSYTNMVRVGRALGVKRRRWQTPMEFAAEIGRLAPGAAEEAMLIAIEYDRRRYARRDPDATVAVSGNLRKVLFGLLGYRIRVIGSSGPELRESRGA